MLKKGILSEDERIELIGGDIINMTPIGSQHVACVNRMNLWFVKNLGERAIIQVQSPIQIGQHSEPQPDIAILEPVSDFYASHLPQAKDILLIVEVADTSLEYDREVKIPLYARAGIGETWLVNLPEQYITVYTEPSESDYEVAKKFTKAKVLSSSIIPDLKVSVQELIG